MGMMWAICKGSQNDNNTLFKPTVGKCGQCTSIPLLSFSLQVGLRTARLAEEEEKTRRVAELTHLSDEAVKQRIVFANRLLDVQKELISAHPPIKVPTYILCIQWDYCCMHMMTAHCRISLPSSAG